MYGREVNGKATTFGTTGYTFNDIFVLYDRQTESIWYPLNDGVFDAISGPGRGSQIPFIDKPPIASLSEWRREHPDTEVLLDDRSRLDQMTTRPPPNDETH